MSKNSTNHDAVGIARGRLACLAAAFAVSTLPAAAATSVPLAEWIHFAATTPVDACFHGFAFEDPATASASPDWQAKPVILAPSVFARIRFADYSLGKRPGDLVEMASKTKWPTPAFTSISMERDGIDVAFEIYGANDQTYRGFVEDATGLPSAARGTNMTSDIAKLQRSVLPYVPADAGVRRCGMRLVVLKPIKVLDPKLRGYYDYPEVTVVLRGRRVIGATSSQAGG